MDKDQKVKIDWFENDIWNGKTGYISWEDPEDQSDTATIIVTITDFPSADGLQTVEQNFERRYVKPFDETEEAVEDTEEVDEIETSEETELEEEPEETPVETEEETGEEIVEESLTESDKPAAESIEDCQKWVDYDMEHYGKVSENTQDIIKKAGYQLIKDDHGDYEVAAGKYESLKEDLGEDEFECCICHKKFTGYGNNPYPVCEEGRCCDDCNWEKVIPARIKQLDKNALPEDIDFEDEEFEECENCREYPELGDDELDFESDIEEIDENLTEDRPDDILIEDEIIDFTNKEEFLKRYDLDKQLEFDGGDLVDLKTGQYTGIVLGKNGTWASTLLRKIAEHYPVEVISDYVEEDNFEDDIDF